MAIAPYRTWQWKLNDNSSPLKIVTTRNTTQPAFKLKETLKKFPLNPWIVKGSGNGSAAAMDGVDRWASTSDIVRAAAEGTAHSWIVLYQPATGIYMLWNAIGTGSGAGEVWLSFGAGFTGGTTTARPTATDQFAIPKSDNSSNLSGIFDTGLNITEIHVWHSADGLQTMAVFYSASATNGLGGGTVDGWLNIGRVADPIAGWQHPNFAFFNCQFGQDDSCIRWCGSDNGLQSGWGELSTSGGRIRIYMTAPMVDFGIGPAVIDTQAYANEISGSMMLAPHRIGCGNSNLRLLLGTWPDWINRSRGNLGLNGYLQPNGYGNFTDSTNTWIMIAYHIYPWDPTVTAPVV